MSFITIIIILLVILLVGLLVDWSKVGQGRKKAVKLPANKQPKAQAFKQEKFTPGLKEEKAKKGKKKEKETFDFDMEEEAQPVLEQVVPEEEPIAYSANQEVLNLLAEADVCFRKGEMKEAEKFYLQAAAKDPRCSKAYSRLGVIYLENGDNWEDAEAAFRQALKTDPNNGFVLNNLGLVLYHQDRYADAIRHFEQAVRQDEYNASRHANLGMAYMAIRQYAKAESSFKKALKLAPNEMEYKDLLNESIEKKKAHKTMVRR